MKHIERIKKKVLKRSSSSARSDPETLPEITQPGDDPDQSPHRGEHYGLFEFKISGVQLESTQPEQFLVDVIAVHGLNGDAYKTWTHPATGKLWLRDFLPNFLPGCRVYTFGYPSKLMDVDTRAGVEQFGRKLLGSLRDHIECSPEETRPLIFICHSLGGIVCKQALVYAHEDDETYGEVLRSTIGIVFLATPHRGSDTADFANVVFKIVNTCKSAATVRLRPPAARVELLEHLRRNSNALQHLLISARHQLQHLSVVTFYETRVTPPLSSLIVDRASAEIGIANEDAMPLWEDHRTICRFVSERSSSYLDVARAIRRIARQPRTVKPALRRASTHSSNIIFNDVEATCVNLLNSFDLAQYEQQPPKPIPGTCQWIRDDRTFVSWFEQGSNAVLWLTGHPGCGKTVLSYSLAQYLKEFGSRSRTVLLYLCQNKGRQTDAKTVLVGLIFQLVGRHRSLITYVRKVYDLQGRGMIQSYALLWNLFLAILQDPKSGFVYIILDALDECERVSCRQLLESIIDMLSNNFYSVQQGVRIKFLLTSRPFFHQSYAANKEALQSRICIDDDQPGYVDDLQTFIRQRVDEICENRHFSLEVRQYLYQSMILKADRTFLWIQVVLASLEKSVRTAKTDLEKIIASVPEDLASTYKRYLASIPPEHQDEASHLLKLLLASSRPLHLDELNVAFTLKSSHLTIADIAQDAQMAVAHTLQSILGPLVRVSASRVSLVHQSVKEFLLEQSTSESGTYPALHMVNVQSSALQLAAVCIQYLLLHDFQTDYFGKPASTSELPGDLTIGNFTGDFWDDEDYSLQAGDLYGEATTLHSDTCDLLSKNFAFYSYATLHWAEHFSLCEDIAPVHLKEAAKSLLDFNTACCRNWLHFYRVQASRSVDDDIFGEDPVVLASQFNSNAVLNELLGEYEPSQATKNRALYWAARLGHDRIVASLLRAGADPNSKELERQTPLTTACENGNLSCVIKMLADHRTDINIPGRGERGALSFACGGGHDDIVQVLFEQPNSKGDEPDHSGATPFFWAVGGGHHSTVRILSQYGANINHQDKRGRTAISWAAGDGMADILTTLLKLPGIRVNIPDKTGRTPLSWASGNGQIKTVQVLLGVTAVNKASVDNDKRTAISWASAGGHHTVLLELLDGGCPGVAAEDVDGWAPLAWAIQTDSAETVQVLLDSKAVRLEGHDRAGRTALSWAVEYGHMKVVDVLLRAGADPESRSFGGGTPISIAKQFGRQDIVHALMAHCKRPTIGPECASGAQQSAADA